MRAINRLLLCYLLALTVLFASVVTDVVIMDRLAGHLETDAKRINTSGRQRMLSQRIVYLAHDVADSPTEQNRAALTQAIADFEQSHDALSAPPDIEQSLAQLFFSQAAGPSLDSRVRSYITLARQIAQNPADTESLALLRRAEGNGLLRDLDAVATEIEAISLANVARKRTIGILALVVAGLVALIEVFFVFLPGHKLLRRTLSDLRTQNAALEASQKKIDEQTAELWQVHEATLVERARLADALEESEALRREQAEFTYAVSHDLKSPTNTVEMVLNEIAMYDADALSEDSTFLLDHGRAAIKRMGDQIEDVLAYSWSTGAKEELAEVDLGACIDEVLESLRTEIDAAEAEIDVGETMTVPGYAKQLRALVANLVSNAVKYRAPGKRPHVRVSCSEGPGPDSIALVVSDDGIGIAPEHHERVFGLFQRLHTRDEYDGSGLGLCTCLRIARNHGGNIALDSAPGGGSTFTVTLPVRDRVETGLGELVA